MAGNFSLPSRVMIGKRASKGLENLVRFALYIDHEGRSLRESLYNYKVQTKE